MPKGIPGPQIVLCSAKRTNGEPCKKLPINGSTVCRTHGGAAKQVKAAAKVRLENAADKMAQLLLRLTVDPDSPYNVKLAAIKDVLDRAGLSATQAVNITGEMQPWEVILTSISREPRHGEIIGSDTDSDTGSDFIDGEYETNDGHTCAGCGCSPAEDETQPEGGWPDYCRDCRENDYENSDSEPRPARSSEISRREVFAGSDPSHRTHPMLRQGSTATLGGSNGHLS